MAKSKKGPKFERDICKQLSLWWTNGKRDDVFWRTSGSGARATTRMKQKECTAFSAGDLGCIDPVGIPFIEQNLVEIKRGYTDTYKAVKNKKTGKWGVRKTNPGIDLLACLDSPKNKKNLLIDWWKKAEKEMIDHNRHRIFIIFKRDRKETCITMRNASLKILVQNHTVPNKIFIKIGYQLLVLIKLEDFLKFCNPSVFKTPKRLGNAPPKRRLKRRRKIKVPD